jgi:hypothetical protein
MFDALSLFSLLPWYWVAVILVLLTSSVAIIGYLLFRSFANENTLRKNQQVASYALNTIALLYCVIVGFVVIRVQERHSLVKDIVVKEANLLLNLYYSSCDVFPNHVCSEIRQRIGDYAHDVIDKEWPLMMQGKDITLSFPRSVHMLWMTYDKINPESSSQAARYHESLSRLNKLSEARFSRLSNVGRSEGAFMWTVLIYGGILVIFTSYLFVSTSLTEHLLHLFIITSFTAMVLFLISSLDSPYIGPTAITPKPFEHVLELIDSKHRVHISS